jgi:hypothetical protein
VTQWPQSNASINRTSNDLRWCGLTIPIYDTLHLPGRYQTSFIHQVSRSRHKGSILKPPFPNRSNTTAKLGVCNDVIRPAEASGNKSAAEPKNREVSSLGSNSDSPREIRRRYLTYKGREIRRSRQPQPDPSQS